MKRLFPRRIFDRPTSPSRQRSAARTGRRLGIEVLEDRVVLSTYTVNSLLDVNPPPGSMTLRQAIQSANADGNTDPLHPDVINFSVAGTITLSSQLQALTGSVSIQGPGRSLLLLTGDQQGDALLTVASGASATVSGLTLDGSATLPGFHNLGILVSQSATLDLHDATVQNAFASANGGALDDRGGVVSVDLCTFASNFAAVGGGAIAVEGGSLTVSRSSFTGDQALGGPGGGVYVSSADPAARATATLVDCTFSNDASQSGGGLGLFQGADATVLDCTFNADSGNAAGGAISVRPNGAGGGGDTLTLSGSTLDGNAAAVGGLGGGLYVPTSLASVTVRDTILAGNLSGKV